MFKLRCIFTQLGHPVFFQLLLDRLLPLGEALFTRRFVFEFTLLPLITICDDSVDCLCSRLVSAQCRRRYTTCSLRCIKAIGVLHHPIHYIGILALLPGSWRSVLVPVGTFVRQRSLGWGIDRGAEAVRLMPIIKPWPLIVIKGAVSRISRSGYLLTDLILGVSPLWAGVLPLSERGPVLVRNNSLLLQLLLDKNVWLDKIAVLIPGTWLDQVDTKYVGEHAIKDTLGYLLRLTWIWIRTID